MRSTEEMVTVAKKLLPEIKIVTEKKRSSGAAAKAGYAAATGEILVVLDADDFEDPRVIPRFLKTLQEEGEMERGS